MTKKVWSDLKGIFTCRKPKLTTFTYYIPAPKNRKSGYREKQFDTLIEKIADSGFKILTINTESHNSSTGSGMWVIVTLKSNSSTLNFSFNEQNNDDEQDLVEGLYQID